MFENADKIVEQYASLFRDLPPGREELKGNIATGRSNDLVAVQGDGAAFLLISVGDSSPRELPASYEALRIVPRSLYTVNLPQGPVTRSFCAIALAPHRRELLSSFAIVGAALLAAMPDEPSIVDVEQFISSYVEMFRSQRVPERSAIKGIWGELWTISQHPDASLMLSAWHPSQSSLFDFSFASMQIEVKTHEGDRAQHHFSHAQLTSMRPAVVVSILVVEDAAGLSITDLMDRISEPLGLEDRMTMARKTFGALGFALEGIEDFRFRSVGNPERAAISTAHIPKVSVPQMAPIYDVSYVVDLSDFLEIHGLSLSSVFDAVS